MVVSLYSYSWTITGGSVVGNSIDFDAVYTGGPDAIGTIMHVTGTVDSNGEMSGDWSDNYQGATRIGTWSTISGAGTKNICTWTDFVKIVAVPSTAELDGLNWVTEDSVVIGQAIWGDFAIIQEVISDPCGEAGLDLMNFKSDLRSGLGNW